MICGCALTKNGDCHECDMHKETEEESDDESEDEVEEKSETKVEAERLPVFWYNRIIVAMLALTRE
jgi:hypothetical protein